MTSISTKVFCAQLEVKQGASNKSRQRLNCGSKVPLPFDVQRNNTAMVSEATYLNGCIVSIRRQ